MYRHRTALFSGAVALTSFLALGAGAATATAATNQGGLTRAAAHVSSARALTLHTETTRVGPKTETILVNSTGLPLYYFRADTLTKSKVSNGLATLWPPVIAAKPSATGVKGTVRSVKQSAGTQVSYNGHLLYTFVDDSPGHVTGQGVSNFFVVTPNIGAIGSRTSGASAPVPAPSRGYGY